MCKLKDQLKAARGDASLAVPALQEAIANERDILFNIQEYLQLPFNYTLCDCYKLTEENKAKLSEEVKAVRTAIEALQKNTALEGENAAPNELRREIKKQLGYVSSIESILNSQCCGRRNRQVGNEQASGEADIGRSQYQTNLKAKNWIYDGMTSSELRLRYFSRASRWNVTNCPLATPFASAGECINCEGSTPYWSMRLERCVGCPKNGYFNATSRSCWITYTSQESSESYHVVKPIRERDESVEPLKGKVIKKEVITRKRTVEKEETSIITPLTGKKITKTVRVAGKRSAGASSRSESTSSRRSSWRTTSKDEIVSPMRSEAVITPLRTAPVTRTTSS